MERCKKTSLNLGNILIVGGLGYLLMRTFMMEERLNDLTVLVKRQSRIGGAETLPPPHAHMERQPASEYETSSDEEEEEDERTKQTPARAVRIQEQQPDSSDDDDDVRIEEQPQVPETPPVNRPPEPTRIQAPNAAESRPSSFVTTRQRRTGSESRRGSRISDE